MSFPSIASVASVVPTDAQKSAMAFLQSGAPRFANPLTSQVADLRAATLSPGGFPLADITDLATGTSFSIPASVSGYEALNDQIQAALGTSMTDVTKLLSPPDPVTNPTGLGISQLMDARDAITNMHAAPQYDNNGNMIDPGGVLTQQNTKVVGKMQEVMSSFSSYSTLKEQFSTPSLGEAPSTTICDSMKDLAGSLGGAADGIISFAKDALSGIGDLFAGASSVVKDALASVMDTIRSITADIRTAISDLVSGVGSLDMSMFDGLKDAFVSMKSSVTDFMQSAATAAGKTLDELKGAVSGLIDDVATGISDLKDMVSSELAKVDGVFQYLKDAALAMSWPSLNPCAKQIAGQCAATAGADPLVTLLA